MDDKLRTLHLFAGAGGGLLADLQIGHEPVGYVEIDDYCQRVIASRIKDGILPDAPIFGDIRTFNSEGFANAYTGLVDIVSGGFPCQDISVAGKGKGIDGERSGLWGEMERTVRIIRPKFVFVENSPMLSLRGARRVFGDLARLGFDARWCVLSAHETGAPHLRKRMFIVANSIGIRWPLMDEDKQKGCPIFNPQSFNEWIDLQAILCVPVETIFPNPVRGILRNDDGLAVGMDRLKAIGNGQCARQAAIAFKILMGKSG